MVNEFGNANPYLITGVCITETGSTVAVIGAGGVGLNAIQGAQLAGAVSIIAIDVNPLKLARATTFGATHVVNAAQEDALLAVRELTKRIGVDYSFEAVGRPDTMRQCWEMARSGGTVVMIGIAPTGKRANTSGQPCCARRAPFDG